jgi:glycosyltransferase involved in cell wall biosynthesis
MTNTAKPRFSVIVPVYNRASTVLATLESVQHQTFGNFECLVVDDGSNDSSELRAVVARLRDRRFRYIWRENGGGGAARNTGIDAATGQFVSFLDSDDLFLPTKLERFDAIIDECSEIAYYSRAYVDRGARSLWVRPTRPIGAREDVGEYLFVHNEFIPTITIVMSRSAAASIRFDPTLRMGQDLDFCVRAQRAGIRFVMEDTPLVIWCDITDTNRTSRAAGADVPIAWLARASPLLSPRARHGYRANVLAYYLADQSPMKAFWYLIIGWWSGGVPGRVTLRQILRCFLPRLWYRKLVDHVVGFRGIRKEQVCEIT